MQACHLGFPTICNQSKPTLLLVRLMQVKKFYQMEKWRNYKHSSLTIACKANGFRGVFCVFRCAGIGTRAKIKREEWGRGEERERGNSPLPLLPSSFALVAIFARSKSEKCTKPVQRKLLPRRLPLEQYIFRCRFFAKFIRAT